MSDQQQVSMQGIIDQLVQRIGQLEFENAVLRAQLVPQPMLPQTNGYAQSDMVENPT